MKIEKQESLYRAISKNGVDKILAFFPLFIRN